MNIKKEISVKKPVSEVWEVLGNQFDQAHKWATGLYHSQGSGMPKINGATCSIRECKTQQGKIREEIRVFDPENYVLGYEVVEGFPFFVKSGVNNWKLAQIGSTTLVSMDFNLETKGLVGAVMKPMMKMQMTRIIENVLKDFKYYVETGIPSPEKEKEMLKLSKKVV
ncbi:SRPBCC family protein [Flagellimonas allohymeniacidonis]|uniref:SRPBCC family protein n=1 Tax=Flagellimonas allohymeniacidonis TaxID=2517819 RepID=A0A4Q8Q9C8_9FLAO|nr:SRPBCC family protein [Allomuricauda hymeniacidonis]TAI46862.1 SRPBCC family protein [Allomuricauda hymeniacidonis]